MPMPRKPTKNYLAFNHTRFEPQPISDTVVDWIDPVNYPWTFDRHPIEALAHLVDVQSRRDAFTNVLDAMDAERARRDAIKALTKGAEFRLTPEEVIRATYRPATHKSARSPRYAIWVDEIPGGVRITPRRGGRCKPWWIYTSVQQLMDRAIKAHVE